MKSNWMTLLFILPMVCFADNTKNDDSVKACDMYHEFCTRIKMHDYGPFEPPECPLFFCTELLAYVSEDGGNTWSKANHIDQATPFINRINKISCSDNGLRCTAVGEYTPTDSAKYVPLMLYTEDGGINWFKGNYQWPNSLLHDRLDLVACDSDGVRCAAVGTNQDYDWVPIGYYTTDGGKNWIQTACFLPPTDMNRMRFKKLSCDRNTMDCTASGIDLDNSRTFKYKSNNGGKTWQIVM